MRLLQQCTLVSRSSGGLTRKVHCDFTRGLGPLVKAYSRLDYQKNIVTRSSNVLDGLTDIFGLLKRVVYGRAELLQESLEVVIELHQVMLLLLDPQQRAEGTEQI
jgi:hypothetical protein